MDDNGEVEDKANENFHEDLNFKFKDESGIYSKRILERFDFRGISFEYACIQRINQKNDKVLSETYVFPNKD